MARPTDPDSLSLKPSTGLPRETRTRPDFSGVRGGADTVPAQASGASSADPTPTSTGTRRYTVKPGDTLSHIAQRHYGNASGWRRIYDANRHLIDDPDLIHPGQDLAIPPANDT